MLVGRELFSSTFNKHNIITYLITSALYDSVLCVIMADVSYRYHHRKRNIMTDNESTLEFLPGYLMDCHLGRYLISGIQVGVFLSGAPDRKVVISCDVFLSTFYGTPQYSSESLAHVWGDVFDTVQYLWHIRVDMYHYHFLCLSPVSICLLGSFISIMLTVMMFNITIIRRGLITRVVVRYAFL